MTEEPTIPDAVSVLVVEDDERLRAILTRHLSRMGYDVRGASDGSAALAALRERGADIVLSDVRMPGMDGRALLDLLRERHPAIKVVLMTAFGSVDDAVEAMSAGAYSYVCKPFKVEEIAAVLRNASSEISLSREVGQLRSTVQGCYGVERLLGGSATMRGVRQGLREAAATTAAVLITGRSGTGKEMAARAVHYEGGRAGGPFVPVNCAAIPEALFESEFFGHARGAFTGAQSSHTGLIAQSSGGTLFLDEVGEMPVAQQAKFLRVLEDGEVRPLGSRAPVQVDLRVVCATNQSLEAMIRQGEFREDLYYRLAVLPIHIPELADRTEDIPVLAEHLLADAALDNGFRAAGFGPDVLDTLKRHSWPGNVRELRNAVERAAIRARGRRIEIADLPPHLGGDTPGDEAAADSAGSAELLSLAEVEKAHVARVLDACGWNRSAAARVLGIDRRTLFSKIKRFGLIGPMR